MVQGSVCCILMMIYLESKKINLPAFAIW